MSWNLPKLILFYRGFRDKRKSLKHQIKETILDSCHESSK